MFRNVDPSVLRVFLGCRTADYLELVGSVLEDTLSAFGVYVLAPLSRQNVSDLAASRGVNSADFLAAVANTGAGPLASLPLTLDLLLRQYVGTGGLQGGAPELYETALLTLAAEPDADRAADQGALGSDEQRLAIAARLCCYLLLCGRAAFWTGPAGGTPPTDLEPSRLAGGEEEQTGGPFAVTSELIAEALRSALFASRGLTRLVPAHATFAAYLAARHLATHNLAESQLRTLLTSQSDTGSVGIVASLRETAAWLVGMRPDATGWLADVEPVSLAAHAAIINDNAMRHLVVQRLLADWRSAMAGSWYRGWHLSHPDLGSQLADVLGPLADPAAAQPPSEQAYLALCLAPDADAASLIAILLGIVAAPHVDAGLRALATEAAAKLDLAAAAPVLLEVLEEITAHPEQDPNDEIRGAVLEATWPGSLAVDRLILALTPPQRQDFVGGYLVFRSRLPGRLADDDVPHLLTWALTGSSVSDPDVQQGGSASGFPFHDSELIQALLDRAFACEQPEGIMRPAAALITAQMRSYKELEVPAALDERDSEGAETASSRALRRLLATELVAQHASKDSVGQLISWGWQRSSAAIAQHNAAVRDGQAGYPHPRRGLLDETDLPWVLELAEAAGPGVTELYVALLRFIYNPADLSAQEIAWATRGSVLWPAFAAMFDAIALDGDTAASARRDHRLSQRRQRTWADAPGHAARVLNLYERASSDPAAFWELLYLLQIDPDTGRGLHQHGDDIAERPGIALLPGGWLDYLREAAWVYLHDGVPPAEDYVDDPNLTSWPAEAGYLALALLARHGVPGRNVDALTPDDLAKWAPAILVFPAVPARADDSTLKRSLLARLASVASDRLPDLVDRILTGQLRLGWRPTELALIDAAFTDAVGDTLFQRIPQLITNLRETLASNPGSPDPDHMTADELRQLEQQRQQWDQRIAALCDTFGLIVTQLLRCQRQRAAEYALAIIADGAIPAADQAAVRAGRIAATSMLTADMAYWSAVIERVNTSPDYERQVLQDLAANQETGALLANLTERQLAELWAQLVQFWPYQLDAVISGAHYVGPDEQAQMWRNAVLNALVQRGTSEAVRLLQDLEANHPTLHWFPDRVRTAQELEREQSWVPPSPTQLTQLLTDRRSRMVRDSADLADLIVEALEVAAGRLQNTGQLLWNNYTTNGRELWRPKSEPDVGAWLSDQLTTELNQSGIVINREVLVRQTSTRGLGLSVDVQADAPVAGETSSLSRPARCRIELKGNWNPDLLEAIRTQLAMDYLMPEGLTDGIYVTAWFDATLWNDESDSRRSRAAARDRETVKQELAMEAQALRRFGLRVRSVIIDIPRPAPGSRSQSSTPAPPSSGISG